MKDDFFIIYEGDEEDAKAAAPPAKPEADKDEPDHAVAGRERRRRALEAKERRRLERIAARDEKIRAKEEARKAREAEYARRVAEYEREKARRQREKDARSKGTTKRFAGEDEPKPAKSKKAPAKHARPAAGGTPAAFGAGPCKVAIPLAIAGALIVLVGLIMFGIWYPAEWYVTVDQTNNGRVKATMAALLAGFLMMIIGNILAAPSVRAARSD